MRTQYSAPLQGTQPLNEKQVEVLETENEQEVKSPVLFYNLKMTPLFSIRYFI